MRFRNAVRRVRAAAQHDRSLGLGQPDTALHLFLMLLTDQGANIGRGIGGHADLIIPIAKTQENNTARVINTNAADKKGEEKKINNSPSNKKNPHGP